MLPVCYDVPKLRTRFDVKLTLIPVPNAHVGLHSLLLLSRGMCPAAALFTMH